MIYLGYSGSKKVEWRGCIVLSLTYYIIASSYKKHMSLYIRGFIYLNITFIWSFSSVYTDYDLFCLTFDDRGKQEVPGKRIRSSTLGFITFGILFGLKMKKNSNKVQPRLHISWALSYYFWLRMSSGARYQRVPILFDKCLGFSLSTFVLYCTFCEIRKLRLSTLVFF